MLAPEVRYSLLLKPNWSAKDIEQYAEVKTTKAYEIRNVAIHQFNGSIKYLTSRVKVDSALRAMGSSLEEQMKIIHEIGLDKSAS